MLDRVPVHNLDTALANYLQYTKIGRETQQLATLQNGGLQWTANQVHPLKMAYRSGVGEKS